jgi:hypothetical protein
MRPQSAEGSNRMATPGDQQIGFPSKHLMVDAIG